MGRPAISLRTTYRRIREQAPWCQPRLITKSDPDHDSICEHLHNTITVLWEGAAIPTQDEIHLDLLARIRACRMPNACATRW